MIEHPSAEERYRSLVENLPASVVILFDQELRIVLVDGPELSATGFAKATMEGRTLHEAVPSELAAVVEPNWRRVLAGEKFSADIPFGDRFYHYEYVPIRGDDGAIRFGLVVGQNITERVRAETERRRLEAQLQQAGKLDALGRLAGGVAHDFNNLLTAIHGYASLVLRGTAPGTEAYLDLVEIQRAADRGTTLTSQLLAFSRKHISEPVLLDLDEVIAGASRLLQRLLGEEIEVATERAASLGKVCVDPGQLEQVLVNLAVNARDAMPGGGRLWISTSDVVLDATYCAQRVDARPGPYVRLTISDTGEGMAPEVLEHVFEPFFTTKGPGHGTGLGLAIVYGIVHGADGFIEVASRPGQGTTFEIYLPSHATDATSAPARKSELPMTPARSVLLVEDEPAVLAVTARILRMHGHTVLAASGGDAALRIAGDRTLRIDVLVSDVIMPGLNGRELHERLRLTRPELPVVFISGYTDDVIAGRLAGGEGFFVQKPFTPAQLLTAIEQAVTHHTDAGSSDHSGSPSRNDRPGQKTPDPDPATRRSPPDRDRRAGRRPAKQRSARRG